MFATDLCTCTWDYSDIKISSYFFFSEGDQSCKHVLQKQYNGLDENLCDWGNYIKRRRSKEFKRLSLNLADGSTSKIIKKHCGDEDVSNDCVTIIVVKSSQFYCDPVLFEMEIKTLTCLVKSFSIPVVVPFPFRSRGLPVQDLQRLHSASMAELDSVTLTKIRWELLD